MRPEPIPQDSNISTTDQTASGRIQSPMLDPASAGAYIGGTAHPIGILTLSDWRVKGIGPRFRKVGRLVRYHLDDLDLWLNSRASKGA
jgi:hypothetical protein